MKVEQKVHPDSVPDSRTAWRRREDYRVACLKHLIGFSNDYRPYSARDQVLAKALDFGSVRSVQRLLRPLVKYGDVVRWTTPPRRTADGASFTKARTLFMRSRFTDTEGALALASLASVEPEVFDLRRVASWLWATPEQAWAFFTVARDLGYVGARFDWKQRVWFRGPNYPAAQVAFVTAPGLPRPVRPAMNTPEILARIYAVVHEAERLALAPRVLEPITNDHLAFAAEVSTSWVEKLVRSEVRANRLHRTVVDGARYLATDPTLLPTPTATSFSTPDWISKTKEIVRAGPRTAEDLRRALLPDTLPRSYAGKLALHGLVVTRFGNEYLVSEGTLSRDFLDARDEKRRARKVEADRLRRHRRAEEARASERWIADEVRSLVWRKYERIFNTRVPFARIEWLRLCATDFRQQVSQDRVTALAHQLRTPDRDDAALADAVADMLVREDGVRHLWQCDVKQRRAAVAAGEFDMSFVNWPR